MRATFRLLASVQKGAQYLEAGVPTGIAGLNTHSAPRSTLLYLYNQTLEKLQQFPESSVYRQSTEALTKHRLSIVESVKPNGLEEWQSRVQKTVDAHPEAFRKIPATSGQGVNFIWKAGTAPLTSNAQAGTPNRFTASEEERADFTKLKKGIKGNAGKLDDKPMKEGPRAAEEKKDLGEYLAYDPTAEQEKAVTIEPEPSLTADQVVTIENQIGAGLIEEVIQVAQGELKLAETMSEHSV